MKKYVVNYGLLNEEYVEEIEVDSDYSAYLKGSKIVYDMVETRKNSNGVFMKVSRKEVK